MRSRAVDGRGHRIEATGMERMAARQPPCAPATVPRSRPCSPGLERVLRATRIEAAARPQQRAQRTLVDADQPLNDRLAHASLICFHNRCKASRSSARRAARPHCARRSRCPPAAARCCCRRKLSRIMTPQPVAADRVAHRARRDRQPEPRASGRSLGRTVAVSNSFPKRRPWRYAAWNSAGRRRRWERWKRADARRCGHAARARRRHRNLLRDQPLAALGASAASTLRPFLVAIRARNPCVRARRTLLG